jgi:hypothetical protein
MTFVQQNAEEAEFEANSFVVKLARAVPENLFEEA